MSEYVVVWEIDITADSPRQAAEEARKYQQDPFSECLHFEVQKDGVLVCHVDLLADE